MSLWKDQPLLIFLSIVGAVVAIDSLLTTTGNVTQTFPKIPELQYTHEPNFYIPRKTPLAVEYVPPNLSVTTQYLKEGRPLRYETGKYLFPLNTIPTLKDQTDTVDYSYIEDFQRIASNTNVNFSF